MRLLFRAALAFTIGWQLANCSKAKASGASLFKDNCSGCHGESGAGDGPAAPYMGVKPRNLVKDPFIQGDSVAAISSTISGGLGAYMPAFGSKLTDPEIDSLAKYVRGLREK